MELQTSLTELWARWDRFWFPDVDLRELAVMRITMGLLLIWWQLTLWPDLELLYTAAGPIDIQLLEDNWSRFRFGPFDGMDIQQLRIVHGVGLAMMVAYTLGFGTRVLNFALVVLLAAYWHRSPWVQNGGDRLLRILCFYLIFTPCGRTWSIDAWIRSRFGASEAPTALPALGVRLIQLQLVVMYTYTGIAKLAGETWRNGTAIYYSLSDVSYARFPGLFDAMMVHAPLRGISMGLSYTTLVWEIFFAPLVIWKKTRYFTLIVGVMLHAGIFATLVVGIFSFASVWGYLSFLEPGWIDRLKSRWDDRKRG